MAGLWEPEVAGQVPRGQETGGIRYRHFGEGQYAETERQIRKLLAETGVSLDDVSENPEADGPVYPGLQSSSSIDEEVTRELFASSIKNRSAFSKRR